MLSLFAKTNGGKLPSGGKTHFFGKTEISGQGVQKLAECYFAHIAHSTSRNLNFNQKQKTLCLLKVM